MSDAVLRLIEGPTILQTISGGLDSYVHPISATSDEDEQDDECSIKFLISVMNSICLFGEYHNLRRSYLYILVVVPYLRFQIGMKGARKTNDYNSRETWLFVPSAIYGL